MSKKILEFKIVPGYEKFACTNTGIVFDALTLGPVKIYKAKDRYLVDNSYYPETVLNLHRLVALTWVVNDNPEKNIVVNHLDGNPLNNHYLNLEWTTYSGNNYHAINTGLRGDPNACRIRDFNTGIVHNFPSVAQACEYMGMPKDTHYNSLRFKQFGKLVKDRYEFRFVGDDEAWFYEGRSEKITPARYKVVVTKPNGTVREIFSTRSFLKEYQLYYSPYGKSIPSLAKHARELFPAVKFDVIDYYTKEMVRIKNRVKSYTTKVKASNSEETIIFDSLTKCAKHFKLCRSAIKYRISNNKAEDGWTIQYI